MENRDSRLRSFVVAFVRFLRTAMNKISKVFDTVIYSDKLSLAISGLIAIAFCISLNYEDLSYQFFNSNAATLNLPAVPVEILVDENNYEVSGVPPTADITVEGDAADIQLVRTQNSATVTADLRNAKDGTTTIALTASGLPTGLDVTVNPETVNAVLARKYTKTFFISADLIVGPGQSLNAYAKPTLSARSVTIKATRDKLNAIRFVRAIVDTSSYDGAFSAEVPLVAYDSNGKQVNVSISPATVMADVQLASGSSSSTTSGKRDSNDSHANATTSLESAKPDSSQKSDPR